MVTFQRAVDLYTAKAMGIKLNHQEELELEEYETQLKKAKRRR